MQFTRIKHAKCLLVEILEFVEVPNTVRHLVNTN